MDQFREHLKNRIIRALAPLGIREILNTQAYGGMSEQLLTGVVLGILSTFAEGLPANYPNGWKPGAGIKTELPVQRPAELAREGITDDEWNDLELQNGYVDFVVPLQNGTVVVIELKQLTIPNVRRKNQVPQSLKTVPVTTAYSHLLQAWCQTTPSLSNQGRNLEKWDLVANGDPPLSSFVHNLVYTRPDNLQAPLRIGRLVDRYHRKKQLIPYTEAVRRLPQYVNNRVVGLTVVAFAKYVVLFNEYDPAPADETDVLTDGLDILNLGD